MILGILAIWLGLAATLTATLSYILALQSERVPAPARRSPAASAPGSRRRPHTAPADPSAAARYQMLARRAFYVSSACAFVAAAVLMSLILGRHYEIQYIYERSGNADLLQYRIASFWAGQEGTFLLWAVYGSVLGLLLIPRSRRFENAVMPFFCGVQLFLFLLMTAMSPFRLVEQPLAASSWQAALQYLGLGSILRPPDGQGLTPLLQNYWMVIHPPIVFIGFATLAVPACFALAALVKRAYDEWIDMAIPWAQFGWMILGIGVFMGGYWAYETLGWGGYWAWDPVENASIVPWFVATASVHGMLAQRARKSLKQANLLLAMTAFFAVIYGTFLTRSGVLAEFSVHSFVAPGRAAYLLMVVFMLGFLFGGIGLWVRRLPDIKGESAYESLTERHFGLFLATVLLIGSAIIIGLGMSFPMIAPLLMGKKGSIGVSAYNRAMVPIGTFVALLMAATPLMPWRHANGVPRAWKWSQKLVYGLCFAILLAGIPAAVIAWTGQRPSAPPIFSTAPAGSMDTSINIGPFPPDYPALGVFAAAIVLALCVSIGMFIKTLRHGILTCGAWVAHTGIALMLTGVMITSLFSKQERLVIPKGDTATAFGFQFRYLGLTKGSGGAEHDHLKFQVTRGSDRMIARLPYYMARMPDGQSQLVRNPAIRKYWDHDLYIAPGEQSDGTDGAELIQGQEAAVGSYRLKFLRFDVAGLPKHGSAPTEPIEVRPLIEVTRGGKTTTLAPAFIMGTDDSVRRVPVTMPGNEHMLSVFRVLTPGEQREHASVQLLVVPMNPTDIASLEVAHKPYINVLWLGGLFMALGPFLAWRRRVLLARKAAQREEEAVPAPVPEPKRRRIPERRPVPVPASGKR